MFFFVKKDDDSRPQGVQLLVVSDCSDSIYHLRQSSSPFHGRWCLGTLDWTDESHGSPIRLTPWDAFLKHLQNRYKLRDHLLTSQLVQDFFLLNLQHHTLPLLDFRYITDQSIWNQPDVWCQGDQGRSKQWRRSLRLKLKKELWKS